MKKVMTMIFIVVLSATTAQNKHYVEEIALYHLDSLTKIDPVFKSFTYYTNGYLANNNSGEDTTHFMSIIPNFVIKSAFKKLEIKENPNLVSFFVPKRIRKNGSSTLLNIFHYTKLNNCYIVRFSIKLGEGGKEALIIMNSDGDLIARKYSTFIY